MLPLLPALLLLILQGPASVERMALDGRLPAALEAIHRQAGDPQQISNVLYQLFSLGDPASDSKPTPHLSLEKDERSTPPTVERGSTRIAQGFAKSQRSRDGPF